ncbi:Kunitz BPTI and Lustrin cystein domain containing protein [Trichuris trichiura]|uniref:Kunitz BPTI and Lustrin cystein domain containing protein n=1 Tax=Trichuris trichiura TaxID=36087 RepID=A0A077YZ98_TRITR|nr:Kunitz BPTI and Lustrin cystein domain containing protein [Trichuris trichiura]
MRFLHSYGTLRFLDGVGDTNEKCARPIAAGSGPYRVERWAYDTKSQSCTSFWFAGLGGNANNFPSLQQCEAACVNGTTKKLIALKCKQGIAIEFSHSLTIAFLYFQVPFASGLSICRLPLVVGVGSSRLARWYFDSRSSSCNPFTYTGLGGNENNFLELSHSKHECEAACPGKGRLRLQSIIDQPDICSQSHWCHIGATAVLSVCCPATDPCQLPLNRGNGNSVLVRWYYSANTKTCLSFSYTGRGGNQNNFLTSDDCKARCPVFDNPCSTGPPHIGLDGRITLCGVATPNICPNTYWCHVGTTLESSVCCPGASNPCELPKSTGKGAASLLRYYYDSATQRCNVFEYSGTAGNENNFMTLQDCEQRCPVFPNPCANGEPARDENEQIVACSVSDLDSCPGGYWCHVGADEQSTLCCPHADTVCMAPVEDGEGKYSLPRYYYNSLTKQCLPFTYSGSGGNRNNFLSLGDCESACPGQPATTSAGHYVLCTATNGQLCPANYWCHVGEPNSVSVCCPGGENPCLLPLESGDGDAMLVRWYFDRTSRRCNRFFYGGVRGNENNFVSKTDCMLRCPELQNPCHHGDPAVSAHGSLLQCDAENQEMCPVGYWCHIGADASTTLCCQEGNPCLLPMLPGEGDQKLKRWYFNQASRQCLEFTYTGRAGNQNNFQSEEECAGKCPVFENPCPDPKSGDKIIHCTGQTKDACPAGYWCHVGLTSATSVCCSGSRLHAQPCAEPLNEGENAWTATAPRWYFDLLERTCKPFFYSGAGGNSNNFLTKSECRLKCPEFVNPCARGEPYRELSTGMIRFCNQGSASTCPLGYWCHVGVNRDSTVCCPGGEKMCELPLSIGTGDATLNRWHFNAAAKRCVHFIYRGLGGNRNNFLSKKLCQEHCTGIFRSAACLNSSIRAPRGHHLRNSSQLAFKPIVATVDSTFPGGKACEQPQNAGLGPYTLRRWFYNKRSGACEPFIYHGTLGNANNFAAEELYSRNPCSGQPFRTTDGELICDDAAGMPCPKTYYCHTDADLSGGVCCHGMSDPCKYPIEVGIGMDNIKRWYFDATSRQCLSFVYSGLGGNANNFMTYSECTIRCKMISSRRCPYGEPYGSNEWEPNGCKAGCPLNYRCISMDGLDQYCCPDASTLSFCLDAICLLPIHRGYSHCKHVPQMRFAFHAPSGQCVPFEFSGCGGNLNNFDTIEFCQSQCELENNE